MTLTPEEAVIGACLIDQEVIREAVKYVMPSDFGSWQGEQTFQAIIDLHSMRKPVDVLTVTAELARHRSKVNASDLHRLIEATPTAANVAYYAEQVADAATRRRLARTGHKLVQEAADPMVMPGTSLQQAIGELKAARDDAPVSSIKGTTMAELMAEPDTYDWCIKNLLEVGDRLIFTADEGGGKSMLTFQIAMLAAAGVHPFWLSKIEPVDVVVFDRENAARRWRRKARPIFEAAQRAGYADPGRIYIEADPYGAFDITKDRSLSYLHKILDHNPCQLLVLGPLYRLVPRAINTDDDAAPLLAALDTLRERGCAIITEAHAGHNRTADLHPVGSSAFLRWPEFGFGLRKDKQVEGRIILERWRGDREERAFPLAFQRGNNPAVPWVAEGVSTYLLGRLTDEPDLLNQPEGTTSGF